MKEYSGNRKNRGFAISINEKAFATLFLSVVLFLFFTPERIFAQEDEWYREKPVKNIVFAGLNTVKASELGGITAPYIGKLFSDELYWDLLGRLYALEYFESITPVAVMADPAGSEVIIRFTVVERPTVSRITFAGNSRVRRNELRNTITLKVKDVVTQVKLRMDEQAIINKYREKGYPDARVRSELTTGNNNTNAVTFHIDEGEMIAIESFHFEGNSVFSSRTLQGLLSLKAKGIIADGAFQESKLMADAQTLARYYHDRGFIDADIIDVVREIRRDDKGNNLMSITFRIYEGGLYTFGGVTFEGNHIFTTRQLSDLIQSKVGETINATRVQNDLMRVADLYHDNGYLYNRIEPVYIRDMERGIFSCNVIIVERGLAYIENIIIRGNTRTKTEVILREIPLYPGSVFSREKVLKAVANLYRLNFFQSVAVETPAGSNDSLVVLVFTVEEGTRINLQPAVVFDPKNFENEKYPIHGRFSFENRNLAGLGNTLSFSLEASLLSLDYQSFTAAYSQRWLFGVPLPLYVDFTVKHSGVWTAEYNVDLSPEEQEKNQKKYDKMVPALVGLSTGYTWNTEAGAFMLGGGHNIGVEYNNIDFVPLDYLLLDSIWATTNSIWLKASLDSRDVPFDPSIGYYLVQRFSLTGFFKSDLDRFFKTETFAEAFLPVLKFRVSDSYTYKVVFGVHSEVSFILPQPFSGFVVQRSNLQAVNGIFNARGWNAAYWKKGEVLFSNWAELRFPVVPRYLALDFFFDAAAVYEKPHDFFNGFAAEDFMFSLGGGLRLTAPQFPLRFFLAKRFGVRDGSVVWEGDPLLSSKDDPTSGLAFVLSFTLSSY